MNRQKSSNETKYLTRNPLKKYFLQRFTRRILELIKQEKPRKLLDVGCGEGFIDEIILEKLPKIKLIGVDVSGSVLSKAKKRNPKGNYLKAALPNLPFSDNNFDLVICLEVLEHLPYYAKALEELIRLSKKKLIISVPNEPWFTILRFLGGQNILQLGKHPEHVNFWNKKLFLKFLKETGMRVKVDTCGPWLIAVIDRKSYLI